MSSHRFASLVSTCLLALSACPAPPQSAGDAGHAAGDGGPQRDASAPGDAAASPDRGDASAGQDAFTADRVPVDSARADAWPPVDSGGDADAAAIGDACERPFARCSGFASREACVETAAGLRLVTETCPAGSGCVAGACVPGQCTDECGLHETGCALFSIVDGVEVAADPAGSTADRARLYRAHVERDVLPQGGIADLIYSDTTLSQVADIGNEYDSAEFTGVYLMAEALRLAATGSPDAARGLERTARDMHLRFQITGSRGYMARFVQSADHPPAGRGDFDCASDPSDHCDVEYGGAHYNWMGSTSRDMYAGAIPGLALAYEACQDEEVRALLREDIVAVVEELMIERTLPVTFSVNGVSYDRDLTSRYLILNPVEMTPEGRVLISVDTEDLEDSSALDGVREFVPDMADVFRQLALLSWLPDIPRPGTCLMLHAFFLAALEVTEGVGAYASRRQAIADFYASEQAYWLEVASGWGYSRQCGEKYYGANIAFTPAYLFAHLDSSLQVRQSLLLDTMWSDVSHHKNAWFAFITAAHAPGAVDDIVQQGRHQVELFPAPPRQHRAVDLTATLPIDPDCVDESGAPMAPPDHAIDTDVRPAENFLWQRHPWKLVVSVDAPQLVYAGVDYLGAYWMGRYHGFVEDDRPGVCARFR